MTRAIGRMAVAVLAGLAVLAATHAAVHRVSGPPTPCPDARPAAP